MTLTLSIFTIVVLITLNEFDPSIAAAGPLMAFLNAFFKSFIYNIITTKKEGDLCKKVFKQAGSNAQGTKLGSKRDN